MTDNAKLMKEVKQLARGHRWVWPGGYPLHAVTHDGASLCATCIRDNFEAVAHETVKGWDCGWRVIGITVNWEDGELLCDHCGDHIESAYAD